MLEKALLRKSFFIPLGFVTKRSRPRTAKPDKRPSRKKKQLNPTKSGQPTGSLPQNPKIYNKELSRERNLLVSFYVYYSGI